jgi:hypothetical protein
VDAGLAVDHVAESQGLRRLRDDLARGTPSSLRRGHPGDDRSAADRHRAE